jgi:tRNA(fMet)-specific endonuclease VapC
MLDTSICIYIIKRKPEEVIARLKQVHVTELCISSIALSELEYGAAKSSWPEQNRAALAEFMAPLEILSYDDMAAQQYGAVRAYLEREGTPIGPMGMLIAAHALSINCTLVTNNISEFSRVPSLRIEDWTSPTK